MTRLTPIFSSKKTMNISYATPRETLLVTPETLPTSEPENPQIVYTVQESDLPTFNIKPFSVVYLGRLLAGGRNVDSVAGNIMWRMVKNGQSVATSSFAVSSLYYYLVEACFFDVKAGDVLGLKLWADMNANWDRSAIAVHPSRIYPLKTPYYKDVTIITVGSQLFTNFNATASSVTLGTTHVYNGITSFIYSSYSTTGFTLSDIPLFACASPYGMIRTALGDATVSNTVRSSTLSTRPTALRFPAPSQFTFRGVFLDRHQ